MYYLKVFSLNGREQKAKPPQKEKLIRPIGSNAVSLLKKTKPWKKTLEGKKGRK